MLQQVLFFDQCVENALTLNLVLEKCPRRPFLRGYFEKNTDFERSVVHLACFFSNALSPAMAVFRT